MATKTQKLKQSTVSQLIGVKNLSAALESTLEYIFHSIIKKKLSKKAQRAIVTHATWIAAITLIVALPELLIFAKEGRLVGLSGFFTAMLFNLSSWVLMLVVLANCLLLAYSLQDIANKKLRGWKKIYLAFTLNLAYIFSQLIQNITQPLTSLISLALISLGLFVLFDIKQYYKKR